MDMFIAFIGSFFGNILLVIPVYLVVNRIIKNKNGIATFSVCVIILALIMVLLGSATADNIITTFAGLLVCLHANRYFESDDEEIKEIGGQKDDRTLEEM